MDSRPSVVPALGLALLLSTIVASPASASAAREFDLQWTVQVTDIPAGAEEAAIWIALPQELAEQEVADLQITSKHPWKFVADPDFGNRVALVVASNPPSSVEISLRAHVSRRAVDSPQPGKLSSEEKELYLREESLVTLSPRVRELAADLGKDDRARYDYVLSAMDYDKSVPGYGRGDTERACDVGKGNCTDFHSLFISLSRAQGVPTVFEMGYPTNPDGEIDRAGGYHCWAWFYRNGAWVAVDISEADKAPEKTDFFYGHLDAERITFSRGRDVILPGMQGEPLNYLPVGAYVEVDGTPHAGVERRLTYHRVEEASS